MDNMTIYKELKSFIDILDNSDQYINTVDYLMDVVEDVEDGEEYSFDQYEVAHTLAYLDAEQRMYSEVESFVMEIYKDEIENGNTNAMCELAMMYYHGYRGMKQDFDQAVKYNMMAAEKGSEQAFENLGYCYYYGKGGTVDYTKALSYFLHGVLTGNSVSLYKIGDMYFNGYIVEKNPEFAMELYNTCIEMANEIDVHDDRILGPVYLRIARMYHYGIGTNQDIDMAIKMYHKAEMHLYQLITEFYDFRFIQSYEEARSGLETIADDLDDEIPVFEW